MVSRISWTTTNTRANFKVVEIVEKIAGMPQAIRLQGVMSFQTLAALPDSLSKGYDHGVWSR